jgi:hypothetical protein
MGDPGPEYTLRRPVDIHTPLPIIFHQNDDDDGGYFIQEDGMATKNRPQPMVGAKVRSFALSRRFLSVATIGSGLGKTCLP